MSRLSSAVRLDLVRSEKSGRHLTTFVVAAVSTILLTRLFLALTGYPQIGGDTGLHVAHVLPGGLLMLVAMALQLSYVGRAPRPVAALLGGAGFGLFIDEVGKFVTADNDYFYEPAVAIMYVVFVALVVGSGKWRARHPLEEDEEVANAAHVLVDGIAGHLPRRRREEVLSTLERLDGHFAARELHDLLSRVEPSPTAVPHRLEHLWVRVGELFDRLATTRWALPLMGACLLLQAAGAALVAAGLWAERGDVGLSFAGVLAGGAGAVAFALAGLVRAPRAGRRAVVESFERSALTSLLVTQVFLFAASQFAALAGLVVALVLLGLVEADLERVRARAGT
ncbi:hypothetical protein MO973_40115 [Paenibacillus sp. TRM 82003]|uniref:hypothetical protein n=1 Tax=Kineococcus sp. TRM81007 TaxID=2925831 RepID=UPI001F5727FD|nr:hypothetical protein [Kineococcus sp. TRM81007]MCI2237122.1 hypothetical protein [Kineococcus sp. TRM81007]MCI3926407.1 hypothetical protein [Paenibacillus sp. TRM 82003]